MKKEIYLQEDGYDTIWRNGPKGSREIHVDVKKDDKLVLEWAFPKVLGSLSASAMVLLEQAILYAKDKEKASAEPRQNVP